MSNLEKWAAKQPQDNYVYVMACGHEYDSPFRRTEGATVTCSAHGQTRLVSGDFLPPHYEQGDTADCRVCGTWIKYTNLTPGIGPGWVADDSSMGCRNRTGRHIPG